MKHHAFLLFLALFGFALPGNCQIGGGAMFTGQRLVFDPNVPSGSFDAGSHSLEGGTFFGQAEFSGLFRLGIDVRGAVTRSGAIGVNSFSFGPRLALALPNSPVRPYIGGELGGAYVRSDSSPKFTGRYADYTALAGVDLAITPRIDWRVFEYSHSTVSGEDIRNQFSTGVVFRLSKLPSLRHR